MQVLLRSPPEIPRLKTDPILVFSHRDNSSSEIKSFTLLLHSSSERLNLNFAEKNNVSNNKIRIKLNINNRKTSGSQSF